jgi:hypothetical protein
MFGSSTKFKGSKKIDTLIQVKTLIQALTYNHFSDIENCDIGINRLDFDLNYNITPSAIFIGSIYGDQDKYSISKNCRPRNNVGNLCDQVSGPGSVNMIRKTLMVKLNVLMLIE